MDFTPSHRIRSRLESQPESENAGSASQPIPVFVAVKRRTGLRQYVRCAFRGFHEPEVARDRPHIWTSEEATLECQFPHTMKLQYIWLEIGNTAPHGTCVDVSVDDHTLVRQKRIRGRATLCARLPEARELHAISLVIKATPFVPGRLFGDSDDNRELGISLRAVVFGKRWSKYGPGSYQDNPLPQRLASVVRRWWSRPAA